MKKNYMLRHSACFSLNLMGDLHIRDTSPACRIDDFQEVMFSKLSFLMGLPGIKIIAGDVFDRWTGSCDLRRYFGFMNRVMDVFNISKDPVLVIAGQHDIPHHRIEDVSDSALGMLLRSCEGVFLIGGELAEGVVLSSVMGMKVVGCSWNEELPEHIEADILVIHKMIWNSRRPPFPGAEGYSAEALLKRYPNVRIILSGDNHTAFSRRQGNRYLLNPGSVLRTRSDQVDHVPGYYTMDTRDGVPKLQVIPHEPGDSVMDMDSLVDAEEQEQHLSAFVKKLTDPQADIETSFEDNLKRYMEENKISSDIREMLEQAMNH